MTRTIRPRVGAPTFVYRDQVRVIVPDDEWTPWFEVAPLERHLCCKVPDIVRQRADQKTDPNLEFGVVHDPPPLRLMREFATIFVAARMVEATRGDLTTNTFVLWLCLRVLPDVMRFASGEPLMPEVVISNAEEFAAAGERLMDEASVYMRTLGDGHIDLPRLRRAPSSRDFLNWLASNQPEAS